MSQSHHHADCGFQPLGPNGHRMALGNVCSIDVVRPGATDPATDTIAGTFAVDVTVGDARLCHLTPHAGVLVVEPTEESCPVVCTRFVPSGALPPPTLTDDERERLAQILADLLMGEVER